MNNNSHMALGKSMQRLQDDVDDTGFTDGDATEDLDCMVTAILSWGHTTCKKIPRSTSDTVRKHTHKELPLGSMDAQLYVGDFEMSLSEHTLRFGNHHFWLKSTDESWHRPMQIYLRALGTPKTKKNMEALRRKVEKSGRKFGPKRCNSPEDAEVGYRQRPIPMKQIHALDEEIDAERPSKRAHDDSRSPWAKAPYGGSSSSGSRRPTQQGTAARSHWVSEYPPGYEEFAREHEDDPAFIGRDPLNDSDA